jgi:hypothetical protein
MSRFAAEPEPPSEEAAAPEIRVSGGGVRLRALALGLLMVVLIVGMTQVLSLQHSAAEVGGGAPAPAPTYLLFFYVLLLAPLLSRFHRRLALSRGELLLIYGMMLVAGPITHQYAIGFLVPHTVSPLYYNAQEPGWALFKSVLPSWFAPTDPAAVKTFFQGGDGTVPWQAWLVPMAAWCALLIVLFFVMLCLNVLVRKQWADSERLTFPLAAIPLALTEADSRADGLRLAEQTEPGASAFFRHPVLLFRHPLFWLGVVVPLTLQAPASLHRYFPSFPELPLQSVILLDAGKQLTPPWNGLGQIEFDLIFWLLGVAYLLPKEITFSAWVFYLIRLLENVVAVWRGTSGEAPSVYSNDFPALFAQGAGAAFALTGITLWTARRHLMRAFRRAFAHGSEADDSGEFLSYRTAFLGALLGVLFLMAWLWLAGMRLWVAGLLLGLLLCYFFIFARIRAETGLGMGVILWPKMLDEVVVTLVGAQYLRLSDLTILHALRWLYFGSATGSVMACQLESFKLADSGGLRGRRVGWALALAATVATPLAFAWTLKTFYASGFEALPIGQRSTSMVGSQIYWSYQNLVAAHDTASGPELGGILAIGAGALVTIALSSLRMRFLWFPLHPVGYLAANSWGMHINWITFLLGWLLNVVITRYGGMKGYRRLLPLFFGLIVGDMLHEGVWGLVAWLTGGRM